MYSISIDDNILQFNDAEEKGRYVHKEYTACKLEQDKRMLDKKYIKDRNRKRLDFAKSKGFKEIGKTKRWKISTNTIENILA